MKAQGKNEPASTGEFRPQPESSSNAHTTKKRRGRIERWQRLKDTRRDETGVQISFHRTLLGSRSASGERRREKSFTPRKKHKILLARSAHRTDFPNWGGGESISIKRLSSSYCSPTRRLRKKRSKKSGSGSMPFCTLR